MASDHHSWDHYRRPGRKHSSHKSKKPGASLPPRHWEPNRSPQDLDAYQNDCHYGQGYRFDVEPLVYPRSYAQSSEFTALRPAMLIPNENLVYHQPDPVSNLSFGIRTLDLVEAPTASKPVASRYVGHPLTKYTSAHVLILTWSFHDLSGGFDETTGESIVSLEEETVKLHDTFESYGYQVHEQQIPMHKSSEWIKATMKEFMGYANDETLLIV